MINNLSELEKKKYAFKYVFSKYLMEIFKVFSYLTVFVVSYLTMFVVLCYGVYEGFTFLMNKYSIDPVFLKSSVVFSIFAFIFMIYGYIKIRDNVNYFKEIIFENQWVKNTGEDPLGNCFNFQYKDGTIKIKVDKRKLDFNLNKNNPIVYYSLFSSRKSPWLVNNKEENENKVLKLLNN